MNNKVTLRELRQQNNKTTSEVAAAIGVSERALCHYECGDRRISIEQVLSLAKIYDVSEKDIIHAQLMSIKLSSSD